MNGKRKIVLADQGRSGYRIVLPRKASPSQRYAARELARFVREISGARLPVVSDRRAPSDFEILLGDNARLPALGIRVDWGNLGMEGFSLRTVGRRLVIAGSGVRGTLYGVYTLLDEYFGCRWFTPRVSRIPKRRRLVLPPLNLTRIPVLEYRESYWTEGFDADWAARNRQNSSHARLEARHGGRIEYQGFVHTMDALVPRRLFASHPEYFTFRDGKRIGGATQRCLTNPDVLRITVRNARKQLRANPKASIISVSQNDNQDFCRCARCKVLDDAEGSHAGTMISFVNEVARALEPEFPHVAVDTLAYQYTRKPPRTVRPRANVIVRLCSIECCFSHPLDGCPEKTNTSFVRDLEGWSRIHRRLYIWDYVTDFVHYLLPFPNFDVLDRNIRTFVRNGAAGIFEQGNYSRGGGGAHCDLKLWIIGRMLWNPALKVGPLIREFVNGVYGPAAKPVMRAIDILRAAVRRSREHVRIFDGAERRFLAPRILRACDRNLVKAERIAISAGDRRLLRRIERMRMPIWYAQTAQVREPKDALKPAVSRLRRAIKVQAVTNITEWRKLKPDLDRLNLVLSRRPVVPLVPGAIVGEDNQFTLWGGAEAVTIVRDEKADDGVAARQPGNWKSGSVQWDLPSPPAGKPGRLYRLRARIRVEKKSDAGPAFHLTVYDIPRAGNAAELAVAAKDVPHDEYRWYEICDLTLERPGRVVWVSPAGNDASIIAVFTDRLELVPLPRR